MLSVPQNNCAYIANTGAVNKHLSGGNSSVDLAGLSGQLDHTADLRDAHIFCGQSHLNSQLAVDLQMPLFAVGGNEELGLAQSVDDLQFLLAGVTGDVQSLTFLIHYFRTLAVQLVDDLGYRFLVAGNCGSGNDDPVAGYNVDLLVGGKGHPVQGRHILALRTGGDDNNFVFRQALYRVQIYDHPGGYFDIAQLLRYFQHVLHAAAGDGYFSAIAVGGGQNRLDPVHIGGKGGDNDPLVTVFKLSVQSFGNHVFAGGVATPLHIGGVTQQGQNALVSQLAQPG